MIKAISYWSVQGGDGSCSAQDAIQQAKNANFQALELCVGTSGQIVSVGHGVLNRGYGVRPVVWVDTEGKIQLNSFRLRFLLMII